MERDEELARREKYFKMMTDLTPDPIKYSAFPYADSAIFRNAPTLASLAVEQKDRAQKIHPVVHHMNLQCLNALN